MVFQGKPNSSTKIIKHEKTKVLKKSKSMPPQVSDPKRRCNGSSVSALKSRIKEMGPICKSRKKCDKGSPTSKQAEEDPDFDWIFDKAGQVSQEESFWLSSESLSPLYNVGDFKFMSPRDYSIDDRLVSLVSSWVDCSLFRDRRIGFFDGAKAPLTLKEATSRDPNASLSFWDSNRTDMWVSLINLDGEDGKWIGNVGSDGDENLESDFPSPSYKTNSAYEVDASSSKRSAHDELSSEILSGSLDLDEMPLDEPLMWPFGDKLHWSSTLDFFVQSPRKGLGASSPFDLLKNDGRKGHHSKEVWKRRILVASSLSASKIVEFKRGNRRIAIATRNTKTMQSKILGLLGKKQKLGKGKRLRTMSLGGIDELNLRMYGGIGDSSYSQTAHSCTSSMDFDAAGWSVSLINLNGEDCQWISEVESNMEEDLDSNFPSPSYKNQESQAHSSNETGVSFQDEMSNWDQMEADEPLFWPYGKDQNWTMTLDTFNVSPRKGLVGMEARRDGANSTSIGVRIHGKKLGFKRSLVGVPGLSASKIIGFKRARGNKGNAKRIKGTKSSFGRSCGRNLAQKMEVIMEVEGEEGAVESMLGLSEFDGHEGIEMEFQTHNFSILEE